MWLRHYTRLTLCLLLHVAFLPPWTAKGKLPLSSGRVCIKPILMNKRFYELIPVVTKAAWEDLLGVLCYKGIEVKTLDSLNNDKQMLLIAEGRKVTNGVREPERTCI